LHAGVPERAFSILSQCEPEQRAGNRHWLVRARNFVVEWVELGAGTAGFAFQCDHEALLIFPGTGGAVRSAVDGAAAQPVPGQSVCIVPPGRHDVSAAQAGICIVIASQRPDLAGRPVLHTQAYAEPDPRVAPIGRPWRRRGSHRLEVLALADIQAPADKPRLKMLQTETLSVNLVEYEGVRDRSALSPHSHADFEQGSLAIAGNFVHHLRVPWIADANLWRDDEHLAAPSPSLLVIPAGMVHTTEGTGGGFHFLMDIFSPPRADFIGKGWVFNSSSYDPPEA
jgi:hypothetical protein